LIASRCRFCVKDATPLYDWGGDGSEGGEMTVLRIVANIAANTVPDTRKFYSDLFGSAVCSDPPPGASAT
jgi:hypothetical protein